MTKKGAEARVHDKRQIKETTGGTRENKQRDGWGYGLHQRTWPARKGIGEQAVSETE